MHFTRSTTASEVPEPTKIGARITGHPALYLSLVVAAIFAAFAYDLRVNGLFRCSAAGYVEDTYLAYCNSTGYGDYDHGAFWFRHEPQTRSAVAAAEVLFLGSSRMAFGFSSDATDQWFAERNVRHYILGFSHSENVRFVTPLLEGIRPSAAAYVINADNFFEDFETPPVAEIFHGEAVESRYNRKRLWQYPHRVLCSAMDALCGDDFAFYRRRATGSWVFRGGILVQGGIMDAPSRSQEEIDRRVKLAAAFLDKLPVRRECVFLTVVPWAATPRAETAAIAAALGVQFFSPQTAGLQTLDGSHLDRPSAERWSAEFFQSAGDSLRRCVATAPRASNATERGASQP